MKDKKILKWSFTVVIALLILDTFTPEDIEFWVCMIVGGLLMSVIFKEYNKNG